MAAEINDKAPKATMVVLGGVMVAKTCLLLRWITGKCPDSLEGTVAALLTNRTTVDGIECLVEIWGLH